ncbi:MAG: hypothetical protein NZM09_07355 [Ignavibacterium sp.]|nr:hypothetical protein [Ignavibacterium sp.]MDW8375499.1 hypothetical protein [Ignavibacteriales bacterium]
MEDFKLNTPVAFIIFNRPDTTKIVFEEIRKAKPKQFFIIADGPRKNKIGEDKICEQTRAIVENIDWECDVKRNYSDINLGCKKRVSSGISWVFENVDRAIFIEDDCLPDQSFFRYCQELLEYYKDREEVMLISGNKVLSDYEVKNYSYYFSRFAHIWGWASWRRVWQKYDVSMSDWAEINQLQFLKNILNNKKAVKYWKTIYDEVYNGDINTWDYQLEYTIWKNKGLSIIPSKNLVLNIGFNNPNATHTGKAGLYGKMKLEKMTFPLSHPSEIISNIEADELESRLFHKLGIKKKIKNHLKKLGISI